MRVRRTTPFQWMTSLDSDEFTSSVLNLCQWIFLAQMGTHHPKGLSDMCLERVKRGGDHPGGAGAQDAQGIGYRPPPMQSLGALAEVTPGLKHGQVRAHTETHTCGSSQGLVVEL